MDGTDGRTVKRAISSVRDSLHASIRSALDSDCSRDAMMPCWPTWTIVCAVRSKALKVYTVQSNPIQSISAARPRTALKKAGEEKTFCTPFEIANAPPYDRIAAPRRRDALQPVDDQLTSLDESRAPGLAGPHFGISLVHELHRSKGCTQGYATHGLEE